MRTLSNPAIESGTDLFEISLILFGSANRPATRHIVKVMASTAKGAKRIVRSFHPRSSSYEVINQTASLLPSSRSIRSKIGAGSTLF